MDTLDACTRGVKAALEKQAAPAAPVSGFRAFIDRLMGRGAESAYKAHQARIMKLPYVARQARAHPRDIATFKTYLEDALRGSTRPLSATQIPTAMRTSGRRQLVHAMREGNKAIAAEQAATLRARLGLGAGIAVPITAGGVAMSAGNGASSKTAADDNNRLIPALAGVGAGAAPIAHGMLSGNLGRGLPRRRQVQTLDELRRRIRAGDIMVTGAKTTSPSIKLPIAVTGADPYGFHTENIVHAARGGADIHALHSSPGDSGAFRLDPFENAKRQGEDFAVLRFKNKKHIRPFLRNLARQERQGDLLGKMLGPAAERTMYDKPRGIAAGVRTLLPKALRKGLASKAPRAGKTICSTLTGMCSPVDLMPGIPKHEIMPQHVMRSPKLKLVGHYRASRKAGERAAEGLYKAAPWALRGLIGAGLGVGAYAGINALMNPSKKE